MWNVNDWRILLFYHQTMCLCLSSSIFWNWYHFSAICIDVKYLLGVLGGRYFFGRVSYRRGFVFWRTQLWKPNNLLWLCIYYWRLKIIENKGASFRFQGRVGGAIYFPSGTKSPPTTKFCKKSENKATEIKSIQNKCMFTTLCFMFLMEYTFVRYLQEKIHN